LGRSDSFDPGRWDSQRIEEDPGGKMPTAWFHGMISTLRIWGPIYNIYNIYITYITYIWLWQNYGDMKTNGTSPPSTWWRCLWYRCPENKIQKKARNMAIRGLAPWTIPEVQGLTDKPTMTGDGWSPHFSWWLGWFIALGLPH
jgi:hypothetical protein